MRSNFEYTISERELLASLDVDDFDPAVVRLQVSELDQLAQDFAQGSERNAKDLNKAYGYWQRAQAIKQHSLQARVIEQHSLRELSTDTESDSSPDDAPDTDGRISEDDSAPGSESSGKSEPVSSIKKPNAWIRMSTIYSMFSWYTAIRFLLITSLGLLQIILAKIIPGYVLIHNVMLQNKVFAFARLSFGLELVMELGVVFSAAFDRSVGGSFGTRFWNALTKDGRPGRMWNALPWFALNLSFDALTFVMTGGLSGILSGGAALVGGLINLVGFTYDFWSARKGIATKIADLEATKAKVESEIVSIAGKENSNFFVLMNLIRQTKKASVKLIQLRQHERNNHLNSTERAQLEADLTVAIKKNEETIFKINQYLGSLQMSDRARLIWLINRGAAIREIEIPKVRQGGSDTMLVVSILLAAIVLLTLSTALGIYGAGVAAATGLAVATVASVTEIVSIAGSVVFFAGAAIYFGLKTRDTYQASECGQKKLNSTSYARIKSKFASCPQELFSRQKPPAPLDGNNNESKAMPNFILEEVRGAANTAYKRTHAAMVYAGSFVPNEVKTAASAATGQVSELADCMATSARERLENRSLFSPWSAPASPPSTSKSAWNTACDDEDDQAMGLQRSSSFPNLSRSL